MTQLKQVGYLQIAEDMDAQRRDWKFQRTCTVVMALVALAGLLGMFGGDGLMSRTAAGDQEAAAPSITESHEVPPRPR